MFCVRTCLGRIPSQGFGGICLLNIIKYLQIAPAALQMSPGNIHSFIHSPIHSFFAYSVTSPELETEDISMKKKDMELFTRSLGFSSL